MEHVNSWRDSAEVFKHQLSLNRRELQSSYPVHWRPLVKSLEFLTTECSARRLVDIGCGVGVYSELIRNHFPEMSYVGYDYSDSALEIARRSWPSDTDFRLAKYQDISPSDMEDGDVIVVNGLLDILPNGDEALEHLLSLSCKSLLLQRINLTTELSNHRVYRAYNSIDTYEYKHNVLNFFKILKKQGYLCKSDFPILRADYHALNVMLIKK